MAIQVHEDHRFPDKFKLVKSSSRYIIIKLSGIKYKNRILKQQEKKLII